MPTQPDLEEMDDVAFLRQECYRLYRERDQWRKAAKWLLMIYYAAKRIYPQIAQFVWIAQQKLGYDLIECPSEIARILNEELREGLYVN